MPARTGQQYIDGLKERPKEVWIRGEKVKDVTAHPAFAGGVRSLAPSTTYSTTRSSRRR